MDQQEQEDQAPSSLWNSSDWTYAAEGGKHALFRYTGSDRDFAGHVLRIAKSDLAGASSFHSRHHGGEDHASPLRTCRIVEFMEEGSCPSQLFRRRIVQPLVGRCYLDLARVIRLPAESCSQLYYRTLASGLVPRSRLPTWKLGTTEASPKFITAALLRDHTTVFYHPRLFPPELPSSALKSSTGSSSNAGTILSVEIKPKAGYITSSPLVLPDHRCKFFRTRYSLQQELMRMGYVQKGWQRTSTRDQQEGREVGGMSYSAQKSSSSEDDSMQGTGAIKPSTYSPLDLFSDDLMQINKALTDLSQNMQNNFRVWSNGELIFGEYETPSDDQCFEILESICHPLAQGLPKGGKLDDPKSTLMDVVIRILSQILKRESLLSNILSMQQLDVIDGDGAVKIYNRLVNLCQGSNVEAEKLLDEAVLVARDGLVFNQGSTGSNIYSDSSPYAMTGDHPSAGANDMDEDDHSLDNLMDEIVQFQAHLINRMQEGLSPDVRIMDASHARCIDCIDRLSKESCIYLLQNWLLSSVMCDVSFFVSFQFFMDKGHAAVEECQSNEHGGIMSISMNDERAGAAASHAMGVHYELKVVDCDPKPARKLRRRGEVEGKFYFIDHAQ